MSVRVKPLLLMGPVQLTLTDNHSLAPRAELNRKVCKLHLLLRLTPILIHLEKLPELSCRHPEPAKTPRPHLYGGCLMGSVLISTDN